MNKLSVFLLLTAVFLTACSSQNEPISPVETTPSPVVSNTAAPTPVVESGVILETPDSTQSVTSPLVIEGLAPGTWFFEGNIVGEIQSEAGETLSTFPLQAEGEWMTEEHVRFTGEVEFEAPAGDESVQLIIRNDNPSGLPENEKSQSFTLLLEP